MFDIIPTKQFEKDIKKYKKKFKNVEDDVDKIVEDLEQGNFIGDEVPNIKVPDKESAYKVRIANTNTKSGKSNGYRMIYYVVKDDKEIYLLTLYYKKDKSDISATEIADLIEAYCI